MNSSWITKASIAWLENLLFERMGVVFKLSRVSSNTLSLMLPGHDGVILFCLREEVFKQSDSKIPCCNWNALSEGWDILSLPYLVAPGFDYLPVPLIKKVDGGFKINYDILGLTYWMLTRQEEVNRQDLDSHGRFPATSSHAYRYSYLDRPIVDEWLLVIRHVILRLWPNINLKKNKFQIFVSHDVDSVSNYRFKSWPFLLKLSLNNIIKKRKFIEGLRVPLIRIKEHKNLHPSDSANSFNWIMSTSEHLGLISTFYFLSGKTNFEYDADYDIHHPIVRRLLREIFSRGHRIGLHPSYNTYNNVELLKKEVQCLYKVAHEEGIRQPEWGARMHYLRWHTPETLVALEMAGLNYDTTLMYADLPGFRCGTCFEFQGFNPVSDKALNIRLRPLIAMECSIIDSLYMGLGVGDESLSRFKKLKAACSAVEGNFTLLWHNTGFTTCEERELYVRVLSDDL